MSKKFEEKNDDEIDESSSSDENEDEHVVLDSCTSGLLYEAKNETKNRKKEKCHE